MSKMHVKGMSKARPSKLQTTMSKRHVKGMPQACHICSIPLTCRLLAFVCSLPWHACDMPLTCRLLIVVCSLLGCAFDMPLTCLLLTFLPLPIYIYICIHICSIPLMTCRLLTFVRSLPWIHKYIYIYIHIYIYISRVHSQSASAPQASRPIRLRRR